MVAAADCKKERDDVARLIYLYLGKHDFFFDKSLLKKNNKNNKKDSPPPAERFFCLYIQWVAYKYAIC